MTESRKTTGARNGTVRNQKAILSVAFPYAPVGPTAVGGAEVICTQVECALQSFGYASVVVAHAESEPQGPFYGTKIPPGQITDAVRCEVEAAHQRNIDRALEEHQVALVHMHGFDFHRYRVPDSVPVVVTLHLPPSWYPESIWQFGDNYHFVCVSESQRQACPAAVRDRIRVIGNGVDIPDVGMVRESGRYALMLARICPEKNLHSGLDAACMAGMPAVLGGAVFPYEAHEQYFAEEIAPRLTSCGKQHESRGRGEERKPTARFVGPVAGAEKARFLSRAACLLLPSLAPETSSLVAMEALAYGTPVIGMAVGAVPEIVEDGRTGFLIQPGDNATERMAACIGRLPELDRKVCRAVAEERFPLQRMLEDYARLYRERSLPPQRQAAPVPGCGFSFADSEEPRDQRELAFEELTSDAALDALAHSWEQLWRNDPGATPFQHPAWLLPWWRQFGPDGTLHAVAVREKATAELVGLLPTYIYQQPDTSQRQLLLLGAGTADYLDGIWAGRNVEVAQQALGSLLSRNDGWNCVSLPQIRRHSPLLRAAGSLQLPLGDAEPVSVLDVSCPLPGKVGANVRRYRRMAAAHADLVCSLASTREEALASFDTLVELHTQRWKSRGEEGVLSDPRVLAHHRESVPKLLDAGLLRLFHLRLGGEAMGVLYGLADAPHVQDRRLYLYLIGFSAQFAALSPGTLLLHEAWQHAADHNFAKVDLLRGGEAYKQLWGATVESTRVIRCGC